MKADKTEELIAKAIAALPYSRPSSGFSARVMAAVTAEAPRAWQAGIFKTAGLIVTAWAAALTYVSLRFLHTNLGDIAAQAIQPGGLQQALNLLTARAALVLAKTASAASFCFDMLSAASAGLPAWYEVAAAALVCSAAVAALSRSARLAGQGI
jgi:hypothetical protein